MSYRERAVLQFEGAPLWILSGPNGAGKSTIFDAITFALFGLHRGGKAHPRELIHKASDGLDVEFDFCIGDHAYRVKRTLSRGGRSSRQAFRIEKDGSGLDLEQGASRSLTAVAQTSSSTGFDKWVGATLGIDDKTFTASVLLQQGRSEALLEADPIEKHRMLSQFVDLSAYERLHEKAETRRRNFDIRAGNLAVQMQQHDPVDPAQLDQLRLDFTAHTAAAQLAQAKLPVLAALIVHAARWQDLLAEQAILDHKVEATAALLSQAQQLEVKARRALELQGVVPQLAQVLAARHDLAGLEEERTRLCRRADELDAKSKDAEAELAMKRAALDELRLRQAGEQARFDEAHRLEQSLAPVRGDLDELLRSREDVARLQHDLSAFAPDLDEQLRALHEQVEERQDAKMWVPWLSQFAQARKEYKTTRTAFRASEVKLEKMAAQLEESTGLEQKISARLPALDASLLAAHQATVQAQAMLAEVERHLKRFEKVDGKPACTYCGQPLTAEHLEAERSRLLGEQKVAAAQVAQATAAQQQVQGEQQAAQQELLQAQQLRLQLEAAQQEEQARLADHRLSGQHLARQGRDVIDNLPQHYWERLDPQRSREPKVFFAASYPKPSELSELIALGAELTSREAVLEEQSRKLEHRTALTGALQPAAARVAALEQTYPTERQAQLLGQMQQARQQMEAARGELDRLGTGVQVEQARHDQVQATAAAARSEQTTARASAGAAQARAEEVRRNLEQRLTALPAAWAETGRTLDDAQLATLRQESAALATAPQLWLEVQQAAREEQVHQERLARLGEELRAVPEEAHCAVDELEQQEAAARALCADETAAATALQQEVFILEQRQERRAELERQQNEARRQADLHRMLSDLLGPQRLQRYLLMRAEADIVQHANQVLDRISGGALRLELKAGDSDGFENPGETAAPRAARALDLLAFNTETTDAPLPVYLLSGSQRFRVAVSLALGIGQHAAQGTRRVDSVIIDEGFGSLDPQGRVEMIEELHNLTNMLQRIILVSHQEEFASSFANRYGIALENGTSKVTLLERG